MTEQANQPQFGIQRIYIKDSSLEVPGAPEIFRKEWKPEINLNMNTNAQKLEEGVFEVTLMLTVTAKLGEETAFIAEVKQSGIFQVSNFPDEQRDQMLGAYCPNILFPYARTTIDALVSQGSFPPVLLAPVNFDALYAQAQAKKQADAEKSGETIQ